MHTKYSQAVERWFYFLLSNTYASQKCCWHPCFSKTCATEKVSEICQSQSTCIWHMFHPNFCDYGFYSSTPISLPWMHQRPNTCCLLEGTMDLPPAVLLYQFSVTTASNVFYLYCSSMLPKIFESDSGNLNVIMKQLSFQCSHNSLGFPGQFGLFLMCRPWENKLWVGNMSSGKCDRICLSRVTWLDCSGEVEINKPFMEVGVGAMQYRDLNSDLPSCISKFHIQDGHEPKQTIFIDGHIIQHLDQQRMHI